MGKKREQQITGLVSTLGLTRTVGLIEWNTSQDSGQGTRDVQKAQYLYLYLYLLRQQNYLYLYLCSNKSGKRLKNPVFVFMTLLILEN